MLKQGQYMDRVTCAERAVPVMAPLSSWPVNILDFDRFGGGF
jgi:hypothetical protein